MARKRARNGRSLEILGNDILHQICEIVSEIDRVGRAPDWGSQVSLVALSRTSRMLRELSLPFLFSEVSVKDYSWPRLGWGPYFTKLTKLSETTSIHRFIKSFGIMVTTNREHENQEPPSGMPALLAQTLQRFPKLQSLRFDIPGECVEPWATELRSADLMLPLVWELSLGSSCEFLIAMCPNVRKLEGPGGFHYASNSHETTFIAAALASKKLTDLKIRGDWSLEMLDYLVKTPNHIENLSGIAPRRGKSVEDIIIRLGRLSNVKSLKLADAANLNVGFHPPGCGNVYRYPGVRERVHKEGIEAEEKVVKMVDAAFNDGSALKELWIGNSALFRRVDESKEGAELDGKRVGRWVRVIA